MTMTYLSPFDAVSAVSFVKNEGGSYDTSRARVNRFGIGYGQKGFWGNQHFATEADARKAYEAKLADLRTVYGKPGRNWTGRFIEESIPGTDASGPHHLIEGKRFVPLKKDGKRGKTIHTVHLYAMPPRHPVELIRKAMPTVEIID
jgi:hypothetical protein